MATRPRRGKRESDGGAEQAPQDRIIDATLALLSERRYGEVGLADIAARAGMPLADLRRTFDGKGAILAAFARRVDIAVLDGGPAEGESARDRLFEVMMRRFDALGPHKAAVASIARAARKDPGLACLLHALSLGSQKWTLAAAGIKTGGCLGAVAVEGTVLVHAEALRAWLDDDDPGQARTMAALDKALRRGEKAMRVLSDICDFFPRMARRRRGGEAPAEAPAG